MRLVVALLTSAALANGQAALTTPPKGPPLPDPFATPSVTKHPKVIGWPAGKAPTAPAGFRVSPFTTEIESPRWLYVLPNGDVLVTQARTLPPKKKEKEADPEKVKGLKESKTVTGTSPNKITLLRDADGDGKPEVRETFLAELNQPFGMVLVKDTFYVANTDGLLAYPYKDGQTKIEGKGRLVHPLPAGGYNNHWTRNVISNAEGSKLYVSVGSGSNVAEHGIANELLRACILEMNPDGTGLRVFASGLRNPVGMAWEPVTKALWTAVNERDGLGDDLVPDYMTSVRDGGFYGWPYAYFGAYEDPRRKDERPDLVKKTIVPDVDLGSHTASLGLTFYTAGRFPEKYRGGAFVGQRGSWNRSKFAGYRVAFVPFKDGKPAGPPEDFLSGFLASDTEAYGRPVGVVVAQDGSLLVTDEPGNTVWRVTATK
ncbi:MAG TPA: sorbosone dehydrogenase family protein [Gemmataceae bacterium]|jgi:glucose/arabinose dehydrogenase|nr:sorbosone dehydrogenase family protein [Gemmataceae bacterium]